MVITRGHTKIIKKNQLKMRSRETIEIARDAQI